MLNSKSSYVSFMLRFQRMQTENRHTWVASMQSTATGESYAFSSIDAFVRFLETEFSERGIETEVGNEPER